MRREGSSTTKIFQLCITITRFGFYGAFMLASYFLYNFYSIMDNNLTQMGSLLVLIIISRLNSILGSDSFKYTQSAALSSAFHLVLTEKKGRRIASSYIRCLTVPCHSYVNKKKKYRNLLKIIYQTT